MALIMGIGDEVIHFAAAVVVMAVAALAWWSTNARPDRYRAVILRPFRYHPDTLTVRSGETPVTLQYTNTESGLETSRTGEPALESRESTDRDVVPLQEMDSIVDAHMALLDNNRLHFYRRVQSGRSVQLSSESTTDTETESTEDGEPASTAQIREMDSIVSAMEADETAGCELFSRTHGSESNSNTLITTPQKDKDKEEEPQSNSGESGVTDAAETSVQINEKKILIRLKYLNDTLKEVEGSLDEMLKDFKWRHLSRELRSSRVRLIFNGRVLGDDAATLRALGLHHRAVVHCLVHPRRTHSHINSSADSPARTEAVGGEDAARVRPALERAWDLESIFMTLVSVALTLIWFFRCEYSNLFTASASVALFGLTVFYSVAIFGLYLSDTFHFDRRLFRAAPRAAQE